MILNWCWISLRNTRKGLMKGEVVTGDSSSPNREVIEEIEEEEIEKGGEEIEKGEEEIEKGDRIGKKTIMKNS